MQCYSIIYTLELKVAFYIELKRKMNNINQCVYIIANKIIFLFYLQYKNKTNNFNFPFSTIKKEPTEGLKIFIIK